jgi:hypothetical protein
MVWSSGSKVCGSEFGAHNLGFKGLRETAEDPFVRVVAVTVFHRHSHKCVHLSLQRMP